MSAIPVSYWYSHENTFHFMVRVRLMEQEVEEGKLKRLGVSLCLFFLVFSMNVSAQSGSPVTFSFDHSTVISGEPVLLRVRIENKGTQVMEFDLGERNEKKLSITVTTPADRRLGKVDPERHEGMSFWSWTHFEPGDDYRVALVLDEWFDFKQAGHYRIDIQPLEPATIGGTKISIPPTSLELEVTPYDSSALEAACKRIAEEVEHPRPGATRLAAEKALERMDDPNLTPFWVKLLTESKALNELAAMHLRSFRRESVEGLSDVLAHTRYDKNRKLARSSLKFIATNAPDAGVRSVAKDALKGK